jgi:hypothetical protein
VFYELLALLCFIIKEENTFSQQNYVVGRIFIPQRKMRRDIRSVIGVIDPLLYVNVKRKRGKNRVPHIVIKNLIGNYLKTKVG